MILENGAVLLTASDLTRASTCEWQVLTALDARQGRRDPVPVEADAMLDRTAMLGDRHEEALLAELRTRTDVVEIPKASLDAEARSLAVALTQQAVDARAGAIFQAAFEGERFFGYADFIELDDEGRYVVSDAKLARRAKVTALLQLAAYARALRTMGVPVADEVRLLLGDGTVSVHQLRDIEPVLLERRARLEQIVDERLAADTALAWGTDGILACGQCAACAEQIALHDDVFQVAGIRKQQRDRLRAVGIETMAQLADAPGGPPKMAPGDLRRAAAAGEVAAALARRIRARRRRRGRRRHPRAAGAVARRPLLRLRGRPAVAARRHWGIDYLFGVRDAAGEFTGFWAHTLAEEKQALIDFLAYVAERRQRHPDLHIYHYASYERTHLLSLAARHGVGEEQIDDLLRGGVLVDLYPVVKRSLVIGSASYSLKKLEPLYMPRVADGRGDERGRLDRVVPAGHRAAGGRRRRRRLPRSSRRSRSTTRTTSSRRTGCATGCWGSWRGPRRDVALQRRRRTSSRPSAPRSSPRARRSSSGCSRPRATTPRSGRPTRWPSPSRRPRSATTRASARPSGGSTSSASRIRSTTGATSGTSSRSTRCSRSGRGSRRS